MGYKCDTLSEAGKQLTEQKLCGYCKGQSSDQKMPRYFQFVQGCPMIASGKVQKFALRAQAIKSLGMEDVTQMHTA
jgi:fatty-acyl-CoA synthase